MSSSPIPTSRVPGGVPIVVHSHLRWDWVWQRPQQFLSRLSADHPVLFIEEPEETDGKQPIGRISAADIFNNVFVFRAGMPAEILRDRTQRDAWQYRLVKDLLDTPLGSRFQKPVQWFYDPMAAPVFLGRLSERVNVYDCMDELSQFRGAPPELIRRERQLLLSADVVFAGGPKMHRSKSKLAGNCHCYGCGVDFHHFHNGRNSARPSAYGGLKGPVLMYFGVVDERLDYSLLSYLAVERPDWNVMIAGPWIKVDPGSLPRHGNLHWMGGQSYLDLPALAAHAEVCLMPFAINEATEFINPTKALEYFATGTPVVSTPVEDVCLQYQDILSLARTPAEFLSACDAAIQNPDAVKIARGVERASANSWEGIVSRLEGHIHDALTRRKTAAPRAA